MGYSTLHTLEIYGDQAKLPEINEWAKNSEEFGWLWDMQSISHDMTLQEVVEYDSYKWYSSDEDMQKLAKAFPDMLFILYGDGEESDDFWKAYYYGDQHQVCRANIVYDPCHLNIPGEIWSNRIYR